MNLNTRQCIIYVTIIPGPGFNHERHNVSGSLFSRYNITRFSKNVYQDTTRIKLNYLLLAFCNLAQTYLT